MKEGKKWYLEEEEEDQVASSPLTYNISVKNID